MPKRVFWPVVLVIMGIILLATNVGMMPRSFWNLWPLLLIIVGLGGLLISDKEEWDTASTKSAPKRTTTTAKKSTKKATRATAKSSSTKKSARAKSRKR